MRNESNPMNAMNPTDRTHSTQRHLAAGASTFGAAKWASAWRWRYAAIALATIGLFAAPLSGCDDDDDELVDFAPPAIPNGVYSITGENIIFLRWNPNREADLAGYRIWYEDPIGSNEFFELANVTADEFLFDNGTPGDIADDYLEYPDDSIGNGEYTSYAVSAYDVAGNESGLSLEFVLDVPRPENDPSNPLVLNPRSTAPALSGYDFSGLSNGSQAFDLASTDVWYDIDGGGIPYLVVPRERVLVQDYGYVGFDVATYAPLEGYSRSDRVEAIEGHTYFFRIAGSGGFGTDDNYAKVEILDLDANSIDLWWGYQLIPGERELKAVPHDAVPSDAPDQEGAR